MMRALVPWLVVAAGIGLVLATAWWIDTTR